jgi:hypothetical protein
MVFKNIREAIDMAPSTTNVKVTSSVWKRRTDACSFSRPIVPVVILQRYLRLVSTPLTMLVDALDNDAGGRYYPSVHPAGTAKGRPPYGFSDRDLKLVRTIG